MGKRWVAPENTGIGLCMKCREVFPIYENRNICPICKGEAHVYNTTQLIHEPILKKEKILPGKMFCPKCFKFNLGISGYGFWD
jgi:hypothetical protein